ncbi:hypothetical protein B9Z55_002368 [Caenorhabditis nigoni]|uniref:Lipid-binding serum glycoprotein N-terminal domain-containing protein n=1 Tax=Caenorhabditis nigoni TaxID=1611254 RepID=A0A2G5VK68_9PELO|nr:hypothetical protein B9Z55_002368 [Caenorhabditis nigoni]
MLKILSVCLLIGTVQSGGYAGGSSGGGGSAVQSVQGAGGSFASGPDFNPILLQGQRGYPGIRARLNSRAFQYASTLVAGLLNTEIKKARIPPISQCIPMVSHFFLETKTVRIESAAGRGSGRELVAVGLSVRDFENTFTDPAQPVET